MLTNFFIRPTLISVVFQRLYKASQNSGYSAERICKTNLKRASGHKFKNFILFRIDFIASHGQTIYHEPPNESNMFLGRSVQLGRGDLINKITRIPTISDFRMNDMSHGGQGAPLVPAIDYLSPRI